PASLAEATSPLGSTSKKCPASAWQVEEQPSPSAVLPSSHCSPLTASTWPSPQTSVPKQSARQPSPDVVLPSSQTSLTLLMVPSPQNSSWQTWLQPSPDAVLPSSHCSPASRKPSPQVGMRWQKASQVAEPGGSHCSPVPTTPSPQTW